MANFAGQLLQTLTLPFFGYLVDAWSLQTMYVLMALILGITGLVSGIGIYGNRKT